MERSDLLHRIERASYHAIAKNRTRIPVGPFEILYNPATQMRWLNGAYLADGAKTVTRDDIDNLVQAFRERDRLPHLELFRELRPELVQMLIDYGFRHEVEMPLMVATRETFRPQPSPRVQTEMLTPEADLAVWLQVGAEAFEHDEPITPDRIEDSRKSLRSGTLYTAVGRIDGQPAAIASIVHFEGVGELAGVGTTKPFRRQGAASAVSTYVLEEFFKNGEIAWLSAGDDSARLVYEKLGFELIGSQVNLYFDQTQ